MNTSDQQVPVKRAWVMPTWMEPYRELIVNTGGNSIEELVNDHHTTAQGNLIRAALIVSVTSQVQLLTLLHQRDMLPVLEMNPAGAPWTP